MLCKLCRKHSPQKAMTGCAVWVDLPCKPVIRQNLVMHNKSEAYINAVEMEADLCSSRRDGGIAMALQMVTSAKRKAFIGSLNCMYFLNYREISHTTKFSPLLELGKSLGAS